MKKNSSMEDVGKKLESIAPDFEKMLEKGFPIQVKQVSPGTVVFVKEGVPYDFHEMEIEALKFYINTFLLLTNEQSEEKSTGGAKEIT